MLFPVWYVGSFIWRRQKYVKAKDMDFVTGLAEIEADT
jgi:amino acid transporter